MPDLSDRRQFLIFGTLCEAALVALAVLLGWIAGINPLDHLEARLSAVVWGLMGTVPLFLLFLLFLRSKIEPLAQIRRFLIDVLGPPISKCHWFEVLLLALFVGFSEELLFRGVLQPWMSRWGVAEGLLGSNILFGLAHFITPLYAVMAGIMGVYLGLLMNLSGDSLLVPMLTHAVYDYVAFLLVARAYLAEQNSRRESTKSE